MGLLFLTSLSKLLQRRRWVNNPLAIAFGRLASGHIRTESSLLGPHIIIFTNIEPVDAC